MIIYKVEGGRYIVNKKHISYFVLLFIICLFPLRVKAECSDSEVNKLKEKAKNITINYYHDDSASYFDYEKGENVKLDGIVNLSINGLDSSYYVLDVNADYIYYYPTFDNDKLSINSVNSDFMEFDIYSSECGVKLRNISISIPNYNKYHDDSICDEVDDDFELCSEFVEDDVDYDTLKKKVEEYKKGKNDSSGSTSNNIMVKIKGNIFELLSNYLLFVVIGLIVITVIIVLIIKRFRNRSVLE